MKLTHYEFSDHFGYSLVAAYTRPSGQLWAYQNDDEVDRFLRGVVEGMLQRNKEREEFPKP